MSLPLFKATTKANWLIGAIFLAVLVLYLAIIISMFDPDSMDALNAMIASFPPELMKAMGFDKLTTDLTAFVASYYYGFIILLFPLIYCVIVANRLVAMHVDRGSMAYLLATPNSRLKVVTTQAVYLIVSITVIFALLTATGIGVSEALFPGELAIGKFLVLNLNAWLLFTAVSGICFFFSCLFNETKWALAFGAGIPVAFFVIEMLANVSDRLDWLRALTLFSLFEPEEILASGSPVGWGGIVLAALALALYGGGITLFDRRDLPL